MIVTILILNRYKFEPTISPFQLLNPVSMKKRFEVLDVFRGIAALLVAIFHYSEAGGTLRNIPLIAGSNRFVAFFFVLSGFIIYHNYHMIKHPKQQINFLIKRFFRLYPLHLFMLILFLFFELCKASLFELGIFNNPAFSVNTIPDLFKNIFMLQSIVKTYKEFSWNYPSWSISAEFFTYIFFALIIYHINMISNKLQYTFLFFISISSFIFLIIGILFFDLILECIYGFFVGCLVNKIYSNLNFKSLGYDVFNILELFAFIAVTVSVCYLPKELSLLLSPLYGLSILIFSFEYGFISKLIKNRITIWLGKLSYSIYMTHALIAAIMRVVLYKLKVSYIVYDISTIIFLSIVVIFSTFTYRLVEVRGQKFAKRITS